MSEACDELYNRVLDGSAVVHVSVKLFSIFIIIFHTPKEMRYLSFFLLNSMMWNFAANLIFVFIHLNPMYPAMCFRADGLIGYVDNELIAHILMAALFFCILNCCVAVGSVFHYRYIVFAFPDLTARVKPSSVFLLCTSIHLITAIPFAYFYIMWIVPYSDYPIKEELPSAGSVICFKPYGWEKNVTVDALFAVIFLSVCPSILSVILLLRSIKKKQGVMHKQLLEKQRNFLFTLLSIASIPTFVGGIPLMIAVVTAIQPHLPYAREICMISIVLITNHGSLYAIVLILAIRPYRSAAQLVLLSLPSRKVHQKVFVIRP